MGIHAKQEHFRKLERMYHVLTVSRLLAVNLTVEAGTAVVEWSGRRGLDRAGAHEDAICFRMVSDAALFAANSIEMENVLTTVDFNVRFLHGAAQGGMFCNGLAVHRADSLFFAQAELFDGQGRCLAIGSGTLRPTDVALASMAGYA